MKTFKLIIEILIGLNTLIIIFSKYIKDYDIFNRLIQTRISINILHILLIIFIIIFWFLFNFKNLSKFHYKYRANRFYKNRIKLKDLLIEYKERKNDELQKDYTKITDILKLDYYFFKEKIYEIQKSLNQEHINIILNNFEECFSWREIHQRESRVRRTIPAELDCFDDLVIGLKEYYNK